MGKKKRSRRRADTAQIFLVVSALGAVATVASQVDLQVRRRQLIPSYSAGNGVSPAVKGKVVRRGNIFDRNGNLLAEDLNLYHFQVDPAKVPHTDSFFVALSQASGISPLELADRIQDADGVLEWQENFDADSKNSIDKVRQDYGADGLEIVKSPGQRRYPLGVSGTPVVGGIWAQNQQLRYGLELGQDTVLGGPYIQGKAPNGRLAAVKAEGDTRYGQDITLTIDQSIQVKTFEALKNAVDSNHADAGAAVVMNPENGDVLALASYPIVDPSEPLPDEKSLKNLAASPLVNRATQQRYEPGSTFKILTLAKAMDLGEVKDQDVVNCTGTHMIGTRASIHCEQHATGRAHGPVTALKAIAESCNVSAAIWAERVGYDEFLNFVDDLGLAKKPNIGVPGELKGFYLENPPNIHLQLANMGFGQSISTNPLALTDAFCTIANNGVRVPPRLILKVGETQQPVKEGIEILSPATCEAVTQYMKAVFDQGGTGHSVGIDGYELAGKTGTAQKVSSKGAKGDVANFMGFVPAEHPKAVILVMVDNPHSVNIHGAAVAGPAFKSIAQAVIERYDIPRSVTINK